MQESALRTGHGCLGRRDVPVAKHIHMSGESVYSLDGKARLLGLILDGEFEAIDSNTSFTAEQLREIADAMEATK